VSAVQPLDCLKHRPVSLREQAFRNMQSIVGVDSDEMGVKGGVVNFRERNAVADYRVTKQLVLIFDDVSSVEQHGLGDPRESATTPVGADDRLSERRLMKTLLDGSQGVSALDFRLRRGKAALARKTEGNTSTLR
jgi:hypothetical protein